VIGERLGCAPNFAGERNGYFQEGLQMKILILGLDGSTWKVLKPLIDAGILPNIQKVVEDGCTAVIESTIPPTTSPAWPSMATGLNP